MRIIKDFWRALSDAALTFSDSWWARRHPGDFIALCILDRIEGGYE